MKDTAPQQCDIFTSTATKLYEKLTLVKDEADNRFPVMIVVSFFMGFKCYD